MLYRLLRLKQRHPAPTEGPLPKERFDLALDRAQQCPAIEGMDEYERKHPDWGMPYALPALTRDEHDTLVRWIEAGAPTSAAPPLAVGARAARRALGGVPQRQQPKGAPRQPLHLRALVHRATSTSTTCPARSISSWCARRRRPGEPIEVIATRRPYDDPGVERAYYRLRRVAEAPLAKTHMPYALNDARMARLKALFHRRAV